MVSCSMAVTSASLSCTLRPEEWSFLPKNLMVTDTRGTMTRQRMVSFHWR